MKKRTVSAVFMVLLLITLMTGCETVREIGDSISGKVSEKAKDIDFDELGKKISKKAEEVKDGVKGLFAEKGNVKDGVIEFHDMKVSFGENKVPDRTGASVTEDDGSGEAKEDGLSSKIYTLKMDQAYEQPVTLSIPVPEDFGSDPDEVLQIGLNVDYETKNGEKGTSVFWLDTDIKDGKAEAQFTPALIKDGPVFKGYSLGTGFYKNMEVDHFSVKYGLYKSLCYYADGHFRVYYPKMLGLDSFISRIGPNGRELLLNDLEAAYEKYLALGYTYDPDDFPMDVHITSSEDVGTFETTWYGKKFITLKKDSFNETYTAGKLNPILWHEFFHYVQSCYITAEMSTDWIDEATASYYESLAEGGTTTLLTAQYFEKTFAGAVPAADSRQDGYTRCFLIHYLSEKLGGDEWIRRVYETGGNDVAFRKETGDPAGWAHDYYKQIALGKSSEDTRVLWKSINTGYYKEDVGGVLELKVPEDTEEDDEEEETVLGSKKLTVEGQGSRFIVIKISEEEAKKLTGKLNAEVSCSGGRVSVISVVKNDKTDCAGQLPKLKESVADERMYLACVTADGETGTKSEVELTVSLKASAPAFEEVCGLYNGMLTVTEVFVSDEFRASMESGMTEDDELGCDLSGLIEQIEASVGQSNECPFEIRATGENTGLFIIEDSEDEAGKIVYDPASGVLTMTMDSGEGIVLSGELTASYNEDKSGINMTGELKTSLIGAEDQLLIRMALDASKGLEK